MKRFQRIFQNYSPYIGMLFWNKKELQTHNMMELENIRLKERSQTQNDVILHDSIYMSCPEQANLETASILVVTRGWVRERMESKVLIVWIQGFYGVMRRF